MVAPTQGRSVLPTDGKRRALLVNPIRLGPTKKSDRPLRSRIFCAAIISVFALIAALVILMDLDGDATAELFSPGPLCNTHKKAVHPETGRAIKCSDCHVRGTPIREDAEGGAQPPKSKWGRKTDENCRKCHKVVPLDRAVPNLKSIGHHTDNEKPEMVRACAACHREHPLACIPIKSRLGKAGLATG